MGRGPRGDLAGGAPDRLPSLRPPHSAVRTKVYAVLDLWVQVCGASAGVLQGGASGEALLSHLLSDISPPADALKVSKAGTASRGPHPGSLRVRPVCDFRSPPPQLRSPRGSPDGGLQSGKPSAPKKLKLDVGEATAPPGRRKGDSNANSDVCAAALRGG